MPQSSSLPDSVQKKPRNVATGIHMLILVFFCVFDAYLLLIRNVATVCCFRLTIVNCIGNALWLDANFELIR